MLDPIRDNLDSLPEDVSKEYTQRDDGRFLLQVASKGGFALEDVAGLKATLGEWKSKHEKKSRDLDAFRDNEGNLVDVKALLQSAAQLEELKDATPKDKVEGIVTQRVAEHKRKFETEVATLNTEKAKLLADLDSVVVEQAAIAAIAKAGAGEYQDLLLLPVMQRLRSDRSEGGKIRPVVLGENDTPRISLKSGSQDLMSVDELIEEMKDQTQFAVCFPGSGNSGAGTHPAVRRPGSQNGNAVILSESDALDPQKYQRAKAQAAKDNVEFQITPAE